MHVLAEANFARRGTQRVPRLVAGSWWCCCLSCFPALAASPPVYHLTTVAGSDQVGDGGQAVAAQVQQPEGIVGDPAGNLYIGDAGNNRVRKVTPAGVISTVAGNGHQGFSGDNGPASAAQLNRPYGLALDAAGDLYISELDGHRVRRVAPGGTISTVAGTGIAGNGGADGGPATAEQLNQPAGLALDGAGNLYIVDSLNFRIRKVAPAGAGTAGTISTVCDQQTFNVQNFVYTINLFGLAADAAGDLYFLDIANSILWQLNPAGVLTPLAGVPGGGYTGDGQSAPQTALIDPVEVALDAAGDLYISELQRVR